MKQSCRSRTCVRIRLSKHTDPDPIFCLKTFQQQLVPEIAWSGWKCILSHFSIIFSSPLVQGRIRIQSFLFGFGSGKADPELTESDETQHCQDLNFSLEKYGSIVKKNCCSGAIPRHFVDVFYFHPNCRALSHKYSKRPHKIQACRRWSRCNGICWVSVSDLLDEYANKSCMDNGHTVQYTLHYTRIWTYCSVYTTLYTYMYTVPLHQLQLCQARFSCIDTDYF